MRLLVMLAATLLPNLLAAAPTASGSAVDPQQARQLVRQLGSNRYQDRERAAAALISLGRAARAALLEGKANPDPEISTRCEQLLPLALSFDLDQRIARFLEDKELKLEHDLPFWKFFCDKVGRDEAARGLYVTMLRVGGMLLETIRDQPTEATNLIQQRIQEIFQELNGNPFAFMKGGGQGGPLSLAEISCLLFATATPVYKPNQPDWMLANLYSQQNFVERLRDPREGAAYRQLFFLHLEARMDDNVAQQCAWLFAQHRLTDGVGVLARALKERKLSQPYSKATALCCVGTLGSKEHLPVIEPFLKDETNVQPFFVGRGQKGFVKMRDIALAITIHLSGKNPKDFGFAMWQLYPNQLIQYHQLGFGSDEERAAAFKKWEEESRKSDPKSEEPIKK